ncbi:hypothetical protein Hdeb2414_s0025g00669301 [Helianthus debilis subsp. tardiflorus]
MSKWYQVPILVPKFSNRLDFRYQSSTVPLLVPVNTDFYLQIPVRTGTESFHTGYF